jgi:aminobenzoyl-glutamate transport protein
VLLRQPDAWQCLGTITATMLPSSLLFLTDWIVLSYVWVFVFGLPVGLEAPTFYAP